MCRGKITRTICTFNIYLTEYIQTNEKGLEQNHNHQANGRGHLKGSYTV